MLKEDAATETGPLADNSGTAAPAYREPEAFFRASYLTAGLKSLLGRLLHGLQPNVLPFQPQLPASTSVKFR